MFGSKKTESVYPDNIKSVEKYVYLNDSRALNGFLEIDQINVCKFKDEVYTIPTNGRICILPRNILEDNIGYSVNIDNSLIIGDEHIKFDQKYMINYLTPEMISSDNLNQYLTHSFICGGEESIDLDGSFLLIKHKQLIPKYTDVNIVSKLLRALNTCIYTREEYTIESKCEEHDIKMIIKVSLSSYLHAKIKNNSNIFELPNEIQED